MAKSDKAQQSGENKADVKSQATERQQDRENQPGRGSGEGKSGMQRGDGHPNGR